MSECILAVEDDDRIAALVRDGLARTGYRVHPAADGLAALAAVRVSTATRVIVSGGDPSHNDGVRHYGSGALSALSDAPDVADTGQDEQLGRRGRRFTNVMRKVASRASTSAGYTVPSQPRLFENPASLHLRGRDTHAQSRRAAHRQRNDR